MMTYLILFFLLCEVQSMHINFSIKISLIKIYWSNMSYNIAQQAWYERDRYGEGEMVCEQI